MNIIYKLYVNVFWCCRRVHKILSEDHSEPIKVPEAEWLSLSAMYPDGTVVDVTDKVKDLFDKKTKLTPDLLEISLNTDRALDWFYLTKTFDYNKIPTEGVLNGL